MFSSGRLNVVATLSAIIIGILVYSIILLLSGGLTRDELVMVPYFGPCLARLAERFRIKRTF